MDHEPRPENPSRAVFAAAARSRLLAPALLALLAPAGFLTGCTGSVTAVGATVEGAPQWLPVYPGSEAELVYSLDGESETTGALSLVTGDEAGEVVTFYRDRMEAQQFRLRVYPFRTDFGRGARIDGHSEDETRGFHATVTPEEGRTTVLINYTYLS